MKAAPDKLQNFLRISLALLAGKKWSEYHLRHWTGKAAFIAAFKKFLFSNLFKVFPLIAQSRCGDGAPTKECVDAIVCVCTLSIISQANLRAPLTSAVAKKF